MIGVAVTAERRLVEICAPVLCKALWKKLLRLPGRPQGGRISNLPFVGMARMHLSRSFLKQRGSRYVVSSTAGEDVKVPPR